MVESEFIGSKGNGISLNRKESEKLEGKRVKEGRKEGRKEAYTGTREGERGRDE